jgi:DNA-binding CsgD family transcriptional regulator
MPLTGDFAQPPLPASRGLVRCRSIYEASVMEDPVGPAHHPGVRGSGGACAAAAQGADEAETGRLHHCDTAATPAGTAGALLIRAPVIIAALREYFEMLWERATPIAPQRGGQPGDRVTPAQHTVLGLMAEGLHDDAIARRAGISTTTVRRHIAAIMDRLNVTSRFAAGAAAQRRGWIG